MTPDQVIVVDDGSTDDSVDSLQDEFGNQIELIQQSNQGPGAARNAGLDRATGDYVWLMDSDDLASRNKLETQVDTLQRERADVVYSPWARVFFDGDRTRLDGPVLQQRSLPESRSVLQWFLTDWSLVFQHCLFRTSILRAAGNYRTDMWTCDDSEYFVRILTHDAKVTFDDRSVTLYRADDHGKVTGSGFVNTRRMMDWSKCLIAMHDMISEGDRRLPLFQLRMWQSFQDLNEHCLDQTQLASELKARLKGGGYTNRALIARVQKAIRTRVSGSHWSSAYRTGPLKAEQRSMIAELGFNVA